MCKNSKRAKDVNILAIISEEAGSSGSMNVLGRMHDPAHGATSRIAILP